MQAIGDSTARSLTSLRALLSLFIPLALSGAFYPIARPVINAALARTANPEHALAAFSVALAVSTLFISPLFGMRQIVTALCVDREMIARLGRICWVLGGAATAACLVLAIPRVYIELTDRVLGIPLQISRLGPPAMLLMVTAPLLTIGRAYYQGILVHYGNANPVGLGALGYLVGSAAVVSAAVSWWGMAGAVAAALALLAGNVAYVMIVWLPTRAMYDAGRIPAHDDGAPAATS